MAGERGGRGKHLLVRADANVQIGTGHVMRCLALAQEWQDAGGSVTFAMRAPDAAIRRRLEVEKVVIEEIAGNEDAAETIYIARRSGAHWVVVDGYGFQAEYQRAIQSGGFPVLFVDDYGHGGEYTAELVLNQNLSADERLYADRSAKTRLLLGTDYALLRREFRARGARRNLFAPVARNVLITMGGADAENVSETALAAVMHLNLAEVEVKLAVGPANPHLDDLRSQANGSGIPVAVVDAPSQMPELMEWADVAVSAAGSTSWELLFMQVPFVGISVADNQRPSARRLSEMGLAVMLDWSSQMRSEDIASALKALIPDAHRRSVMARRGRELVDGRGVERVIAAMTEAA